MLILLPIGLQGDNDVWLDVCYHSNEQPDRFTPDYSDAYDHPQLLINGGGHHWDSNGLGGLKEVYQEPQFIQNAHLWEIRIVKKWLKDCKFGSLRGLNVLY